MALGANGRIILQFILNDFARVIAFGESVRLVVTVAVACIYRAFLYGIAELEPLLMSAALNSRAATPFRCKIKSCRRHAIPGADGHS